MKHILKQLGLNSSNFSEIIADEKVSKAVIDTLKIPPYRFARFKDIFIQGQLENQWFDKLNLSTRTLNVLLRNNILDLNCIWEMSPRDLLDLRNAGFGTFDEVCIKLFQNIDLSGSDIDSPVRLSFNSTEKPKKSFKDQHLLAQEILDFFLLNLSSKDVQIIREAIENQMQYPDHFYIRSKSKTDTFTVQILKSKLNFGIPGSVIQDVFSQPNKILTISEIQKEHPKLRLGVSIGFNFISLFEILVFLEFLTSRDGYIFIGKDVNNRQRTVFYSSWRDSENSMVLVEKCNLEGLILSEGVINQFLSEKKLVESEIVTRRQKSEISDLSGDDLWINELINKRKGEEDIA